VPDPVADADAYAHAVPVPVRHTPADADPVSVQHATTDADARAAADLSEPSATRVGAIVACVDRDQRVLVVHQTTGPFADAWLLPGGLVEPNERVEDAARRELAEETGYTVESLRPVAVYDVRVGPSFHVVVHMLRSDGLHGAPRAEPGSRVRWVRPSEIALHPIMASQLADLGLIERDAAQLARDLASAGVEQHRLA
jgi:ADP-ribose pyrophosphatase YjhB (NUDIX family)